MFRLAALNEETSDGPGSDDQAPRGTKEAQEAQAFDLYNYALQLQQDQNHNDAIRVYEELLETSLVTRAATTLVDENGEAMEHPLKDPGLILKYSTHKNMASMLAERGDINAAMEHYLQAVMLDTTDVTLWLCIGTHAIALGRLALARHAFISGLKCNENHWPCLDWAITVLYALLDYESCLYWIAKALEKDPEYTKGLVLREKMFSECPHLRRDSSDLFRHCSFSIYDAVLDEEESEEIVSEALRLREHHKRLCQPKPPHELTLAPLSTLSWVDVGERILTGYDVIMKDKKYSFASPIRFGNFDNLKTTNAEKGIARTQLIDVEGIYDKNDAVVDETEAIIPSKDTSNVGEANQCNTAMLPEPDESSAASQSALEDLFSEDSVTSGGKLPYAPSQAFASSLILSQEIATSEVSTDCEDDVVGDIMDTMLQCVTSQIDETDVTVSKIVEELVAMTTKDCNTADETIKNLVCEMLDKVNEAEMGICSEDDTWNVNEENQTVQHNTVHGCTETVSENFDEEKVKKVPKRKKLSLDTATEEQLKRRSNRVRVSSKRRQHNDSLVSPPVSKTTDYRGRVVELLPDHLKDFSPSEDLLEDECRTHSVSILEPSSAKLYHCEKKDVSSFIEENDSNFLITIMQNYCYALSEKINLSWKKDTCNEFIKIFFKSRSHVSLPNLSDEMDLVSWKKLLFAMLAYVEYLVDSNMKNTSSMHGEKQQDLEVCLSYLASAATHCHLFKITNSEKEIHDDKSLNRDWKAFALRLLWARSKHHLTLDKNEAAITDLETCSEILNKMRTNPLSDDPYVADAPHSYKIELPNMVHQPVISINAIKERLDLLEETRILESANSFFAQEKYKKVIDVLEPTARKQIAPCDSPRANRPQQIRQFLLSCQHLSAYQTIFTSSASLLNEVTVRLANIAKQKAAKKDGNPSTSDFIDKAAVESLKRWKGVLHVLLQVVDRAFSRNSDVFLELDLNERRNLTHKVIGVVYFLIAQLGQGYNLLDMTLSWTIMYKILVAEEKNDVNLLTNQEASSSFRLLSTAHEWMGEKSLCCSAGGSLLKFIISEIEKRFSNVKNYPFKAEVTNCVEQCLFCLYAYPSKPKPRRIQDHSAKQIELNWRDCILLFRHFRPETLPEFDSFKTITVSMELSQILLKAVGVAPNNVLLQIPNTETDISTFIENGCDDNVTFNPPPDSPDLLNLGDMYYLLADYYFKNKEMTKAVKYYLLDVRINPERFDSWAGMALARSSQTDDRLRLCETKKSQHKVKDSGTERRGLAALACFKQALSFDSKSVKLWIEYGSLAYWMHSLYSRKRKMQSRPSDDMTSNVKKMLKLSRMSFENVLDIESEDINEEEWLVYYMLGKISEKERKPLKIFIKYYQTAAGLLHRKHAKYPKRIQAKYGYANDLAIEALEMHFRIHASLLKYTLSNSNMPQEDIAFMKDVVDEMANGPFVKRQELKSMISSSQELEKASKLTMTSTSSDLTMGSLLPDNILQALNIEDVKADEENDTELSSSSITQPSGEQSQEASIPGGQSSSTLPTTLPVTQASDTSQRGDIVASTVTELSEESRKADCDYVVDACETAFRICVHRFQHHNKALYRLAHLYAKCEPRKHLTWSRDLLYGSSSPWQQLRHMPAPGLLSDRNKTNLFNGVWRLPMDDIDRPGSFAAHLYRCLALLLDVLRELKDNETLLHIHNLLHRIPEHGKKYLREEDRVCLARRALVFCRGILNRRLRSLSTQASVSNPATKHSDIYQVTKHPSLPFNKDSDLPHHKIFQDVDQDIGNMQSVVDSLSLLMDAYKVYQDTHKHNDATTNTDFDTEPDDTTQQRLLADAYHKYTCLTRDSNQSMSPSNQNILEEAIRFCQQQTALKKTAHISSTTKSVPMKHPSQGDIVKPIPRTTSPGYPRRQHNLESLKEVKELNIDDEVSENMGENGVSEICPNSFRPVVDKPSQGKITMVEKEGKTYTRIGVPRGFAPSPDSAFRSTALQGDMEGKRFRMDPGLRHLQGADATKNRLIRSTSVPVTYADGEENTPPHHRPLYRTGSFVSDSTKLKLKTAILAKTSAALVRKPSITDFEMMQIQTDPADSDSSQSEDEDDETQESFSNVRKRKLSDDETTPSVSTNEHSPIMSPHQSTVISTAGST